MMTETMMPRIAARGRIEPPKFKSDLERDYDLVLAARMRAQSIAWYGYECWKFELAPGVWFTPDFVVLSIEPIAGVVEIHETKGWMREAARVRLLTARRLYPMFRWRVVRRDGPLAFTLTDPT